MYEVSYHPRSLKFLSKLSKPERNRIIFKIELLQKDPFSKKIDIKKLSNKNLSYRLRVGKTRLIFEIHEDFKKIYMNKIDFRGNIY